MVAPYFLALRDGMPGTAVGVSGVPPACLRCVLYAVSQNSNSHFSFDHDLKLCQYQ